MDSAHLGKMTKKENDQKLSLKGWSLEKTGNQELLPKHTLEWKVSHGLLKKQHQREEIMKNRERISLLGDRRKTGSGTQGSKGGGINRTLNPWNDTIKRGRRPTTRGRADDNEIIKENSVRTQKSKKRGRDISRYPKQPL